MKKIALVGAVLVIAYAIAGCAPATDPGPPAGTPSEGPVSASPMTATRSVVVVGDSNSTGFQGSLQTGLTSGAAWAARLPADRFAPIEGWAVDGATTEAMRAGIVGPGIVGQGVSTDQLIVMAGTNDLATGVAPEVALENITSIVDGVGAQEVLLLAIAPFDAVAERATAFNAALEAMADRRGWDFLDPWGASRGEGGVWVSGASPDGVHATPEGYAAAGDEVARHLEGQR